jgi:hypothetical protein
MLGSNWKRIMLNALKYGGVNLVIKPSTRKDKKVMLLNPLTNKWIHFGQRGYDDYTEHQDEKRLRYFRQRNAKWKDAEKYSPAWASYYILWS